MISCRQPLLEHFFISRRRASGFTLIELMVAILILGILTAATVSTLTVALDNSRVPSAARTIQAALEGARDRASHANEPRGLRLYYEDVEGHYMVRSMAYLEVVENETAGDIEVRRDSSMGPPTWGDADVVNGTGVNWNSLYNRGLLTEKSKVRLGNWWYHIQSGTLSSSITSDRLRIVPEYRDATGTNMDISAGFVNEGDHEVTLAPVEMADEDPISFPDGVFIDLSVLELQSPSIRPLAWGALADSDYVDIMFSPLGTVDGPLSIQGLLHLPIVEIEDVTLGFDFGDENKEGNESLVTIFTQTGQISTPPINTDNGGTDPFKLARTGITE
ncbi:hypothetical protein Pla110_35580 [Polystyrenella longa]|uniref:Uncharacterized protein n=1 Tax=Polystyrenella longa TaxID=2528007 RepID=A0A518CRG6_9PLAN|nr:prepilin-type N-terminal cleavage/methylation domain-containing protein [Polystyrenella longa]QDU81808.1 hypothetical protein Pla110_35580 [Polystyrenella longa]